ncbi:Terpene synthase 21, putative [Theobroma cacao]|uniref:(+)-delta-cadinene synthase n=1 Tax=Theobroma cacao TaxID=3641 RepID=A0A061FBH4_THECC|nr:Terpene synthase 21, putative [Theobroma cacao]
MSSKGECHVLRPVANFSKNIWRDQFPSLPSSDSVFDSLTKEIIPLKEKVKEMLKASTADPMENVKFIDTLLRLGVSYHFENDIEMQLERIFNSQENLFHKDDYDLNSTSIAFRVSRLHGFKMSCGVFEKFKDGSVGKFKESLVDDIRGMLSLYEAAYLRVHGELILEEAIAFTKANLKPLAAKSSPHLAKQIMNALDNPLNKCPPRLEARNYISFYEEEESRNETLLTFAKLDFNRVQVLHRQEISQIARFWEDYDFSSELSYARERYVEVYTWINSLYFEPRYARWRIILTKMLVLMSILDDTFDAYGTPQELQRFTDALKRWEISALDELQDYTKVICKAVLDLFDEIEDEARKEGRSYTVPYAKDAFIGLINNYQAEVKWCHDGYVPTFEEYMRVAMKTSTYDPIITTSFIGMGTIAGLEAFEWLQTEPRIMTAANMIGRIMDDIASHKFEQLREHCPSSVECYMKQHNLSEKDALHDLKKKLEDGWKDINEECMRPTAIPRDLLLRILNFARVTYLFYKHGDGYTDPDPYMKDDIRALFVDPVRI